MCGMVGYSRPQGGWAAPRQSPRMLLEVCSLCTGTPMQGLMPDGLVNKASQGCICLCVQRVFASGSRGSTSRFREGVCHWVRGSGFVSRGCLPHHPAETSKIVTNATLPKVTDMLLQ